MTHRSVLFIGNECLSWTPAQFASAAREAHALGFDAISPKRANGTQKWYRDAATLKAEHQAVLAEHCDYLPFSYCYGPHFGIAQINAECDILREMLSVFGAACADMEVEWNGATEGAIQLAGRMHGHSGTLSVTTWADPVQQNWQGVIHNLQSVVDVWVPQQYTVWLASVEGQYGNLEGKIQPALEINKEFQGNDPTAVLHTAQERHHTTLWMWEYKQATANPTFTKSLNAMWHAGDVPIPEPAPTPVKPKPQPTGGKPPVTQTDYHLISGVPHISSYEIGKSEARDAASCLAALAAFAYPNRWPNLANLASQIYSQFAGSDTSDNATPLTVAQALSWCATQHIGTHDLAPVIALNDVDALRHEMAAMTNTNGIPVLLFLEDGSKLATSDGKPLHPYMAAGHAHAIVRLGGYSDHPWTLILDPAAQCPPLPFPTPVMWNDTAGGTGIVQGKIVAAFGVMPPKVSAPPADFRFSVNGEDQKWPVPQPDITTMATTLLSTVKARREAERTAIISAMQQADSQEDQAFLDVLKQLGYKG